MHALNLVLDDLSMVSGLSINKGKSVLYIVGVDNAMNFKLVQASQVLKGVRPFRYLGVPLFAKRLGIQDCLVLVEKNTSTLITGLLGTFLWPVDFSLSEVLFRVCIPTGLKSLSFLQKLSRWLKLCVTSLFGVVVEILKLSLM